MEQKEIIEGRQLIQQFMGLPTTKQTPSFSGGFKTVSWTLDYDSNWNVLMSVVEKINKSNKWDIIIYRSTVHVNDRMDMIIETTSEEYGSLLLAVFGAVLQFIQFYNALNK